MAEIGYPLQLSKTLLSIHPRHVQVQKDHVRHLYLLVLEQIQSFVATGSGKAPDTAIYLIYRLHKKFLIINIVVNDEKGPLVIHIALQYD